VCLPADDIALLKHTRVYIVADYFNIADLKELCAMKFAKEGPSMWKSDTLVDAIADVYSIPLGGDDQGDRNAMREAVIKVIQEHLRELHENERFRKLLKQHAELSADIINVLLPMLPARTITPWREGVRRERFSITRT
jgi:hypothetical protein